MNFQEQEFEGKEWNEKHKDNNPISLLLLPFVVIAFMIMLPITWVLYLIKGEARQ